MSSAAGATVCGMDWTECRHQWERLRWARKAAGFERPTDAARSLDIKPVTYRTYEHAPADGGREPPLTEIQRMARKFRVNWVWLAAGEGNPTEGHVADERVQEIDQRVARLPKDQRDLALDAALNVIRAFNRR